MLEKYDIAEVVDDTVPDENYKRELIMRCKVGGDKIKEDVSNWVTKYTTASLKK